MSREPLGRHILPSAATMVGVCLTSISLVKLLEDKQGFGSVVDQYLALDSILFLVSATLSYFSLRAVERSKVIDYLERLADVMFIIGLSVMVVIATLFAYAGI